MGKYLVNPCNFQLIDITSSSFFFLCDGEDLKMDG